MKLPPEIPQPNFEYIRGIGTVGFDRMEVIYAHTRLQQLSKELMEAQAEIRELRREHKRYKNHVAAHIQTEIERCSDQLDRCFVLPAHHPDHPYICSRCDGRGCTEQP